MVEKTIAKNIRSLRKARKMTLQDVEDRTGLSKGYLSKVERGLKFPPFSTMGQIAGALGVEVSFLLKDKLPGTPDIRIALTPAGQGNKGQTLTEERGYRYEALAAGKPGKNMIPYIIEVAAQEEQVFTHEGEEFLYVLEGKMEFSYDDQTYIMNQGDSVYFESAVPHSGRSIAKGKTRLLAVMYNYKRL